MRFTVAELAEVVGGELHGVAPDAPLPSVDGAGIDSRRDLRGRLFVAVRAERDGHDFVPDAVAAGASAVLVDHAVEVPVPQVIVPDTVAALGRAGAAARRRLAGPVVGITGSVGKTSTKDLLAAVFAVVGPTAASERSLNNELGVPLTLLDAPAGAQRAVLEMGARGPGHIAHLCRIAAPQVGVVTAVAAAHTETFGSLEDIGRAKGELVEALPTDGLAVLTRAYPEVAAMAPRSSAPIVWFGEGGDVVAEAVELDDELRPRFRLRSPWGDAPVQLGVRGRHNVANALAAAAAALGRGLDVEAVVTGLAAAGASPWRMDLRTSVAGGRVLDDSYNANPASMRAALRTLAELPARRRTAVLGVMAELGDDAAAAHRAIAAEAASLGIEVVAVGTGLYGIEPLPDVAAAVAALAPPTEGQAALVKGSRVAGLERLAAAWTGEG